MQFLVKDIQDHSQIESKSLQLNKTLTDIG